MESLTLARCENVFGVFETRSKQLTHAYKQKFFEISEQFAEIFKFISVSESQHSMFYISEYLLVVAILVDILETLQFGIVNTSSQRKQHADYIVDFRKGSWVHLVQCTKPLTLCCGNGLSEMVKLMKVDKKERDIAENLANRISNVESDLQKFRILFKESVLTTLSTSFRTHNKKYSLKGFGISEYTTHYLDVSYKASYNSQAETTHMEIYETIRKAENSGRALMDIIENVSLSSPQGFDHSLILANRQERLIKEKQDEEEAKRISLLKKQQRELEKQRIQDESKRNKVTAAVGAPGKLSSRSTTLVNDHRGLMEDDDDEDEDDDDDEDEDVSTNDEASHNKRRDNGQGRGQCIITSKVEQYSRSKSSTSKSDHNTSCTTNESMDKSATDSPIGFVADTTSSSPIFSSGDLFDTQSASGDYHVSRRMGDESDDEWKKRGRDDEDETFDDENVVKKKKKLSTSAVSACDENFIVDDDDSGAKKKSLKKAKKLKLQHKAEEKARLRADSKRAKLAKKSEKFLKNITEKEKQRLCAPSDGSKKQRSSVGLPAEQLRSYVADYEINKIFSDGQVSERLGENEEEAEFRADVDANTKRLVQQCVKRLLDERKDVEGIEMDEVERQKVTTELVNSHLKKNAKADEMLRTALGNCIEAEFFKEVTIERLLVAFCIAKREALGLQPVDKIEIDFVEVIYEIVDHFKEELQNSSEQILEEILVRIDNAENLTASQKIDKKQAMTTSMHTFVKYGKRKVNSIGNRLVSKVGGLWALIQREENEKYLRIEEDLVHGNKGSLFAFSAHEFSFFQGICHADGSVGPIDGLLSQLRGVTTRKENVDALIAFSVSQRPLRSAPPKNSEDIRKFMATQSNKKEGDSTDHIVSSAAGYLASQILQETTSSGGLITTGSESSVSALNHTTSPEAAQNEATKKSLKDFLIALYSGIEGRTENLATKLHARYNAKKTCLLPLIGLVCGYLDSEDSDTAVVQKMQTELQKNTDIFTNIGCNFFVPFKEDERLNIASDGYCFYRAVYAMYLQAKKYFYMLTPAQLRKMDDALASTYDDNRKGFFDFFNLLEEHLPEECGKSKVSHAQFTFFYMQCPLDSNFWGSLDSVAFLPFPCSGFGGHSDSDFSGWAKFWCSSLCKTPLSDIGSIPMLSDIQKIMVNHPNYIVHGQAHFFTIEAATQELMESSFATCVRQMLSQILTRLRMICSTFCLSGDDLVRICSSLAVGSAVTTDVSMIYNCTELLATSHKVVDDEDAPVVVSASIKSEDIDKVFELLQSVDNDEGKRKVEKIISKYKKYRIRMQAMEEVIVGLKNMIQRNMVSKKNPVDLVTCDDQKDGSATSRINPVDLVSSDDQKVKSV